MSRLTPEQIDKLLPQTQCGLCGYGGCMPYAEAMAFEQASIHLCPPGGVKTLMALGELLNQDPTPFIAEMEVKTKLETKAVIRENECIGCTKCIQACPVDAILGSAKQMHTIIQMECTGCELCIPACPVDCIDLLSPIPTTEKIQTAKADLSRERFQIREQRLLKEKQIKQVRHHTLSLGEKKDYVQEALARALAKKNKVSESK